MHFIVYVHCVGMLKVQLLLDNKTNKRTNVKITIFATSRNCDMFRSNLTFFRVLLNIGKTGVKNIGGFLNTLKCVLKYFLVL